MIWLRNLALGGIMLLPLLLLSGTNSRQNSGEMLYQALRATGAILAESRVQGWTRLPPGHPGVAELQSRIRQGIAAQGEEPANYRFATDNTAEYDSVQAVRIIPDRRETITATIRKDEPAAFLLVTISGAAEQITGLEQQAEKILSTSGTIPRISSCLVGWINGKLSNGERGDILSRSFALLNVKHIYIINDAGLTSASGYSSRLPAGLPIGGGAMVNINMASRYHSTDHRTYITLGTPIITHEY